MADEFVFQDAELSDTAALIRVRTLWNGPSGSGKSYSCLAVATALAKLLEPVYGFLPTIWAIDTEKESLLLYRLDFKFKHLPMAPPHSVVRYLRALDVVREKAKEGDIVLLDSGSHAWMGPGGILERVDKEATRFGGNKWSAWSVLTPDQNRFIDSLLSLNQHLFMTTRAKTEWGTETVKGKEVPKKIGTTPIQRDGLEYEFTVQMDIDNRHVGHVGKTRIKSIADEEFPEPGLNLAKSLFAFLMTGKGDPTKDELKAGIERYKKSPPKFPSPAPATVTMAADPRATQPTASAAPAHGATEKPKEETVKTADSTGAPEKKTEDAPAAHGPHNDPQINEHRRLADLLAKAAAENDTSIFRTFPSMVSKASAAKLLDKVGYDDLVESFNIYKRAVKK